MPLNFLLYFFTQVFIKVDIYQKKCFCTVGSRQLHTLLFLTNELEICIMIKVFPHFVMITTLFNLNAYALQLFFNLYASTLCDLLLVTSLRNCVNPCSSRQKNNCHLLMD